MAHTRDPQINDGLDVYFGYGSNLWNKQMSLRCRSSQLKGIGRLPGYRWMINDRGYANIVTSESKTEVYGVVYGLAISDVKALDQNEGVPLAYTKENFVIDFWPVNHGGGTIDVLKDAKKLHALVYIDRLRIDDDQAKDEYVHRINEGIKDGLKLGIPQKYFAENVRPFIPVEGTEDSKELAARQAPNFEDED